MKSVRLEPALEARLDEAARISGEPVSDIIRQAIAQRCNAILEERLDHRLSDVIGVIESDGGRSRSTGAAFRQVLQGRQKVG